jgi:hypothetical protein
MGLGVAARVLRHRRGSVTCSRTIAGVLQDSLILDANDRRDAAQWAVALGTDVERAVRECPRAEWLVALAYELGAGEQVADWWHAARKIPSGEYRGATLRGSLDLEPMAFFLGRPPQRPMTAIDFAIVRRALERVRRLDRRRLGKFLHAVAFGMICGPACGRVSPAGSRVLARAVAGNESGRQIARYGHW